MAVGHTIRLHTPTVESAPDSTVAQGSTAQAAVAGLVGVATASDNDHQASEQAGVVAGVRVSRRDASVASPRSQSGGRDMTDGSSRPRSSYCGMDYIPDRRLFAA